MVELPKCQRSWRIEALLRYATGCVVLLTAAAGEIHAQQRAQQRAARPFTSQDSARIPRLSEKFLAEIRADSLRRERVVVRMRMVATHLGHLPFDIKEYHDEQPFPDGAGGYGPMAYVFASPYLAGFTHVNHFNAHGQYGAFAAVLWVDEGPTELPDSYKRLNLVRGMNCVFLAHTGNSVMIGWTAYIVPGSEDTGCPRPATGAQPLPVTPTRGGLVNPGPRDYPSVARFSEAATGQPMIGVGCVTAWCQIGPAGANPKGPSHANGGPFATRREGKVPGWHDDQLLSVPSPTGLVPSIRATVTPVANLDTKPLSEFTDRWVEVATIWLEGDPAGTKYGDKWGMSKGANVLELSYAYGAWHGRVAPRNTTKFTTLVVVQEKHFDMVVPGTARFRWRNTDESVWVPCEQGCCRVDAIMDDSGG